MTSPTNITVIQNDTHDIERRRLKGRVSRNVARLADAAEALNRVARSAFELSGSGRMVMTVEALDHLQVAYDEAMTAREVYLMEATGAGEAVQAVRDAMAAANVLTGLHDAVASGCGVEAANIAVFEVQAPAALAKLDHAERLVDSTVAFWGALVTEFSPFSDVARWVGTMRRWEADGHYTTPVVMPTI